MFYSDCDYSGFFFFQKIEKKTENRGWKITDYGYPEKIEKFIMATKKFFTQKCS